MLETLNGTKFLDLFLFISPGDIGNPSKNMPETNYDDMDNNVRVVVTIIIANV